MEPPSVKKFIDKVAEVEWIYTTLSRKEKTQALQFLLPVIRRFTSLIKGGEGDKTCDQEQDSIHIVLLILEKQISKAVQLLERSCCKNTDSEASDSNGSEPTQQSLNMKDFGGVCTCQKTIDERKNADEDLENHRSGMTEDTGNQENESDELCLLSPNKRKRSHKKSCPPLCSEEQSRADDDLRQILPADRIERKQPIKLLVKKAFKTKKLHGEKIDIPASSGTETNFLCSLCNSGFSQERLYLSHLVHGHQSSPCCCRFCAQLLDSGLSFKNHRSSCSQSKPSPLRSPITEIASTLEDDSSRDLTERECAMSSDCKARSSYKFQCNLCDKRFQRKKWLHIHYKKHGEGRFACEKCGKILPNQQAYDRHEKVHIAGTFVCESCGKEFNKASQYDTHVQSHASLECTLCWEEFSSRQELEDHVMFAHKQELSSLSYGCRECNKTFLRPSLLHIHRRTHTGEKPFQCFECKTDFRTKKDLSKHRQTNKHMVKEGLTVKEKKYICSQCGKRYYRKQALQSHMKHHSEDAPLKCQFCNFTSHETNNLKRHMDLHFEAKRNFVCEVCGAAFHAKSTLDTHIAFKHSEFRLFKCDLCEASFKVKNMLKRHLLVHSKEKSHQCWCGVGFKRLTNLRRHMMKLHGGAEGLLPPVRRVKTLDFSKKAPISRTDLMADTAPGPTTDHLDSNIMPCNQDSSADHNSAGMVPMPQDTHRNSTNAAMSVTCCQSGFNVIHPLFQNQSNVTPLTQESLYTGDPLTCTVSAKSRSDGLSSHVIRQIQEVFDLSQINME